jgi:hypothetical protein
VVWCSHLVRDEIARQHVAHGGHGSERELRWYREDRKR